MDGGGRAALGAQAEGNVRLMYVGGGAAWHGCRGAIADELDKYLRNIFPLYAPKNISKVLITKT